MKENRKEINMINCHNRDCPENVPHPSGNGRTCGLTITSITEAGLCEHWDVIKVEEFLKKVKEAKREGN
jgi:hypothetical protein